MSAERPPPADWYHDPYDPTRARYWDGSAWTDRQADLPAGEEVPTLDPRLGVARPSRRRRMLVVASIAVVVAAAGVVAVAANRPDPDIEARVAGTDLLRVRGGLELNQVGLVGRMVDEPCRGTAAFAEVGPGTRIEVRNLKGRRIATARLSAGRTVVADPNGSGPFASLLVVCRFDFTLEIPDLDQYRIGVAGFGDQRFAREELAERGWRVELGLGP